MKMTILVGKIEDQYPEALDVFDELPLEENPQILQDKIAVHKSLYELRILEVEVPVNLDSLFWSKKTDADVVSVTEVKS